MVDDYKINYVSLYGTFSMFHVECIRNGGAMDRHGDKISLFKDIRPIFAELKEVSIPLAAASRYASLLAWSVP